MNRYYPNTVESLRESQRRAFDNTASANMFSELIDKHGRHDWLDPVMDSLGPYVQLQLGGTSTLLINYLLSLYSNWNYEIHSDSIRLSFVTPFLFKRSITD